MGPLIYQVEMGPLILQQGQRTGKKKKMGKTQQGRERRGKNKACKGKNPKVEGRRSYGKKEEENMRE
jgi:hypothetical protein